MRVEDETSSGDGFDEVLSCSRGEPLQGAIAFSSPTQQVCSAMVPCSVKDTLLCESFSTKFRSGGLVL